MISGVDVSTARMMKPADASLNPVISMSFSTDFMAKWLADAMPTSEAANISSCTRGSSSIMSQVNRSLPRYTLRALGL